MKGYDTWSEYGPFRIGLNGDGTDVYRNADFIGKLPYETAWSFVKTLANADNARINSGYSR